MMRVVLDEERVERDPEAGRHDLVHHAEEGVGAVC